MSQDKPPSTNGRRSLKDRILNQFSKVPNDQESLIDMVRAAEENNVLEPDALAMIEGALQVCDMRVRDIMIPRVQMVSVNSDDDPKDILNRVIESGHSRFPVISSTKDDVIGILLAKDLLQYFASEDGSDFQLKDAMRPAVFVPESKRLNVLLREFRANRNHMAIIIDEYCSVAGLVTIEDVIEEIVGEIEDEHDVEDEEFFIQRHKLNRYTVQALTPIENFNEFFDTDYKDEEYDTIGGMILNSFGHVPKRGETLELDGFNIKVLRADKRRIQLMRFIKLETTPEITDDTT